MLCPFNDSLFSILFFILLLSNILCCSLLGVHNLLTVAGTIPDRVSSETPAPLKISDNTRMNAALALKTVWEDLISEAEQKIYKESVEIYFK